MLHPPSAQQAPPPQPGKQSRQNPPPIWLPPDYPLWTEERKALWMALPKNPGKYYYRFTPPGVPRRNVPWSEAERSRFLALLETRPPDGEWGFFSMHIPGRTGQQCERFYEQLKREDRDGRAGKTGYEVGDEDGRGGYTVPATSTSLIKAALDRLQATLGQQGKLKDLYDEEHREAALSIHHQQHPLAHNQPQSHSQRGPTTPRRENKNAALQPDSPPVHTSPHGQGSKGNYTANFNAKDDADDDDKMLSVSSALLSSTKTLLNAGKDGKSLFAGADMEPLGPLPLPSAASGAGSSGRKRVTAPPQLGNEALPAPSPLRVARVQIEPQPQVNFIDTEARATSLKAAALSGSNDLSQDLFSKRTRTAKDTLGVPHSQPSPTAEPEGQKHVRVMEKEAPPANEAAVRASTNASLALAHLDEAAKATKLTPDVEHEGEGEHLAITHNLTASERSLLEKAAQGQLAVSPSHVPALRALQVAAMGGNGVATATTLREAEQIVNKLTPAELTSLAAADTLTSAVADGLTRNTAHIQTHVAPRATAPLLAVAAQSRLPHMDAPLSEEDVVRANAYGPIIPPCDPVAHLRPSNVKSNHALVRKTQPAIGNPINWTSEISQQLVQAYEEVALASRMKAQLEESERAMAQAHAPSEGASTQSFGFLAGCKHLKTQMDPDRLSSDPLQSTSAAARERYAAMNNRFKLLFPRARSAFSIVPTYEQSLPPPLTETMGTRDPNSAASALASHGLIVPKALIRSLVQPPNPTESESMTEPGTARGSPQWQTVPIPGSGFRKVVTESDM